MPKFARGGDIDLDEAYGTLLNDKHAAMRRNIRTKTYMNKSHHCEDPECGGGAPKAKCITKLHFAFCLAPVVDEEPDSPTFGEVVIHGERFPMISTTGCAEHPYIAEYNLDLKDARKDRAKYEIRWKKIFESFKLEYETSLAEKAEKAKAMKKMLGMTGHQRQTMRARLDSIEYQKRQKSEVASEKTEIWSDKHTDDIVSQQPKSQELVLLPIPTATAETTPVRADDKWLVMGEIVPAIAAVAPEDLQSILEPMWLHDELFAGTTNNKDSKGVPDDWNTILKTVEELELPEPTTLWLHDELFPEPDPSIMIPALGSDSLATAAPIAMEDPVAITDAPSRTQIHRKDAKVAKKQRAAVSRALKRTRLEDRLSQAEEEMALAHSLRRQKSLKKRTKNRTGLSRFA
ncbi:hypothetical protein HBH53_211880 [Parastagonospora nodorum]|nr:hypothetical protein HBH53_211880 [Parastagonospora nodorum]KAH4062414.1 hypothetical protein HBH50_208610 [Parastagonospora nodorum]KAH4080725.1 hypothetical protein HBH48_207200 [Parastagonospora nodorum]KAH4416399.1 hypothetical protein HBH92_072710 [Parastagonospora nodorum]KAH4444315.1 hypothetical protein HBH93_071590 [Parastagonospora nodorum]